MADEVDAPLAEYAHAGPCGNPAVTSAIVGPRRDEASRRRFACAQVRIPDEHLA